MDGSPRIPGLRRIVELSSSRRVQQEVDDELQFHLDMRTADLVKAGLSAGRGREQALREFGDVADARGELAAIDRRRHARHDRVEWWSDLWHDVQFAVRVLRRQPG